MLEYVLNSFKKIKDVAEALLGQEAAHKLLIVLVVAALLLAVRPFFPDAGPLIDTALFICVVFGIIIAAYGIFTHQTVTGLGLQKGFVIGMIAGALAALSGGAAYYGFDVSTCCKPEWDVKLFRLLTASVPMGGVLGALMGWLRPSGPAAQPAGAAPQPTVNFLSFMIGIFLLLVLCVAFFYIFDKMRILVGDADSPQGLLRFWHVALLLFSFVTVYVFLIVYLYGRADGPGNESERRAHAVSSAITAALCSAILFAAASALFGHEDFQPRNQATVCTVTSIAGQCLDCVKNEVCLGDPKEANFISGILVRTIILVVILMASYLLATHPRSAMLRIIDNAEWLRRAQSL
jgi:hypothetical protein